MIAIEGSNKMTTVYKENFDYPIESGRYRLAVSHSCPFAQRTMIARSLLGLEEAISLTATNPIKTEKIWDFTNHQDDKDPIFGVTYLKELYLNTDPNYTGPFSVPALVDTTTNKVVNQESLDIVRDFSTRFKPYHKENAPDLYPEALQTDIEAWNGKIGIDILVNPSKASQAKSQKLFNRFAKHYYQSLTELEELFSDGRSYLLGEELTESDIVLYTALIRHDVIYRFAYGLSKYELRDFNNLWKYMIHLYSLPAFKDSTDFEEIKMGAFLGKNSTNLFKREILPDGPNLSHWER